MLAMLSSPPCQELVDVVLVSVLLTIAKGRQEAACHHFSRL